MNVISCPKVYFKRWVVGVGIVWLGGVAGCKDKTVQEITALPTLDAPSQVMKHFKMQDIQGGERTMLLDAQKGQLVEAKQWVDLEILNATFYKQGVAESVLRAPRGRVYIETHAMESSGGVTVVTTDRTTLTTDRLRYDPVRRKLLSDDAVLLEKPDSLTEGVGLEADPDLSVVKIGHEKVHLKRGAKAVS